MSEHLPFRIQNGAMGIEIVARVNTSLNVLKGYLYGILQPLSQGFYDRLHAAGYNSFFQPSLQQGTQILYGPIAYLNHQCGLQVQLHNHQWTLPLIISGREQRMPGVRLTHTEDLNVQYKAGEQILICYNTVVQNCQCAVHQA